MILVDFIENVFLCLFLILYSSRLVGTGVIPRKADILPVQYDLVLLAAYFTIKCYYTNGKSDNFFILLFLMLVTCHVYVLQSGYPQEPEQQQPVRLFVPSKTSLTLPGAYKTLFIVKALKCFQ